MVFNKTLFVFGLIAISFVSAYPAGTNEKSEAVVEATTERALNDEAPVTTEQVVLADDIVSTVLPVVVRSEVSDAAVQEVPAPTEAPSVPIVVIPEEKTSPVVVAEVVGEKIVPVVEIINVAPPAVKASTDVKSGVTPQESNAVDGRSR